MPLWKFRSAVLVLLVMPSLLAADAVVTLDTNTRYQTILGWGATVTEIDLPAALRQQILDEAVNDLGLTRLRLEIPRREWEDPLNDDGDPNHINWNAFKTTTTDRLMKDWVIPFKQRVEARGEPFNLYVSPSFFDGGSTGSVPVWMLYSPGEYAEWATAFLLYLRNTYGVVADYYCICNEAGNNNPFTPQVVADMIKALGPRLQNLGFTTKIEFPESISPDTAWKYIQTTKDDADMWRWVGVITYHLYGSRTSRPLIRDFALSKGIPTGQTEYMGTTIDDLYEDLTEGGVSFWEHYALIWYGDDAGSGLYFAANYNRTSFSRYREYWKFRQVMHYVRPGAVRVKATCSDSAVRPLAFVRDGKVTVVLINKGPALQVTVTNLPEGTYGVCQAVSSNPYEELGLRTVGADGSLTVTAQANSVVTIWPHPDVNLPPNFTKWKATPGYLELSGDSVTLTAAATDPEGDAISYLWSIASIPDGAHVTLTSPDQPITQAHGLTVPGQYTFTVTASDGVNAVSRRVTVPVFAENQPPTIVDVHNRLPVTVTLPNHSTNLRAGAFDLEHDPLTFRWSIVSQPAGANAMLFGPPMNGRWRAVSMRVAGDYIFRIEVSDPTHTVSQDLKVTVWPANQAPVISHITATPAIVTLPTSSVLLTAITSDPDGDIVTHWWSVKSAPAGAKPVFENPGASQTFVRGLTKPGQYTFTLAAIDRTKVTQKTATVTVLEALAGDANGDGHVDLADLLIVTNAFGTSVGEDAFDERADLNGDDSVDMQDLLIVVQNFGTVR